MDGRLGPLEHNVLRGTVKRESFEDTGNDFVCLYILEKAVCVCLQEVEELLLRALNVHY